MADTDPVQRLHYFDHQFLREKDFTAEQEYHIRMRRSHNSSLHTWGIATGGLVLGGNTGDSSVTVSVGTAIDSNGREMVLAQVRSVDVSGFVNKTLFITIAYSEQQDSAATDPGVTGFTRWTESPLIEAAEVTPPPAQVGLKLVLGSVKVDANGKLSGPPDNSSGTGRRAAGVVAGDLEATSVTLTGGMKAATAALSGNLQVGGAITVTGTVDGRDVSADGAKLDGHVSDLTNPHKTTAEQAKALPITGGSVSGLTLIRNAANAKQALIATVQPAAGTQPTTVDAALNAISGVDGVAGLFVRSTSANTPVPAAAAPSLRVDGEVVINGNLKVSGSKGNYVVDTFINASGKQLRTGDVVRLKGTPVARFYGLNNKIPVAEVTLADAEHASMVIGIVDQEATPDSNAPDTRTTPEDPTIIDDGGELLVVTLGAYAHCKVDASSAPVAVGDLLASSPNPGFAQKATDPKLGNIIGKALEPLDAGTGYIAVFVNIQ
jgi:cytoskeletal protein CcmA (bactofilin family)